MIEQEGFRKKCGRARVECMCGGKKMVNCEGGGVVYIELGGTKVKFSSLCMPMYHISTKFQKSPCTVMVHTK